MVYILCEVIIVDKKQIEEIREQLSQSDYDMIRILEDLLVVLIDKKIIKYTDLPAEALQKLSQRTVLREKLKLINPIDYDEVDPLL